MPQRIWKQIGDWRSVRHSLEARLNVSLASVEAYPLVAIVAGPTAMLGFVYQVAGSAFLMERPKGTCRWQQGFLGLGLGTQELVPFPRIKRIEVSGDFEDELRSGDLQDVAIFGPEHPQAGEALYNPYYMYVITHPQGNVLLDTGAHPTLRTDPRSRLGDMADVFEAPWDFLMDVANHRRDFLQPAAGPKRWFWTMTWEERIIWGVTAGILMHFYWFMSAATRS